MDKCIGCFGASMNDCDICPYYDKRMTDLDKDPDRSIVRDTHECIHKEKAPKKDTIIISHDDGIVP